VGGRDWLAGLPTLAQHLAQAGYRCMLSGKWHIGCSESLRPGFHDWFAIGQPQGGHAGRQRYSDQGRIVYCTGFKTDVVTEHAIRLLREHAAEEPLLLVVGYIGTHSPWAGHPRRLVERYRSRPLQPVAEAPPRNLDNGPVRAFDPQEALAQYYAAVTHIDEGVGRILDALESLGLRDDTVVVYTSDHGLALGQHGVYGKGNGTSPKNMYETSILVPLIWNHPGELPAGRAVDHLVDHCDLFCTLLDYAGVRGPLADPQLPGQSYLPLLRGQGQAWEDVYFGEYGPVRCVRTRSHKLVRRFGHGPDELYDLEADPRERDNRIADPALAPVLRELDRRLEAFFARYEDPARSGLRFDPDSRGVGAQHVAGR
jgi:choline-sulfatase